MNKTKTYVLMISTKYLTYHPKAGQDTYFDIKLKNGLSVHNEALLSYYDKDCNKTKMLITGRKIHTIRANYTLWSERIKQVQAGKAVLSIRIWSGQPYKSKQREIEKITKENHPAVEFVMIGKSTAAVSEHFLSQRLIDVSLEELANNDGLTIEDFKDWFKNKATFIGAIIHFTPFRYCK